MRVWFVSELYYPEETSTGYLLTRIAEGLACKRQVSVLCSQPTYSSRGRRARVVEDRAGVRIIRCVGSTFSKDKLAGRVLNILSFSLSTLLSGLRRFRPGDVVIVVTNPPLLPFVIRLAAALRGACYVLLVHDVYPEAFFAAGIVHRGTVIARLSSWVGSWPYRSARRVVVLGRDMEELVSGKPGVRASRIVRIPNWADVDDISPSRRSSNAMLQSLGLASKWVLQYAGNMGRTHGLDWVVESAPAVQTRVPDVHFLFIGWGARLSMLQAQAEQAPDLFTVVSPRPRSDQQNFLNACDAALLCFGPGMAGVSVPSRMYNVLAAGKPIIAVTDSNSELARVITEWNVGWVVPPKRPDLLADAAVEARKATVEDPGLASRARRAAEAYTLRQTVDAYEAMLEGLVREHLKNPPRTLHK